MSYAEESSRSVKFKRKLVKAIAGLPQNVRENLEALIDDIRVTGPVRGDWPNYSKLSDGSHHCHLTYNDVSVWKVVDRQIRVIEVTYVGSRKNAPY